MTISLSGRHPGFIFRPLLCRLEDLDLSRLSHACRRLSALVALAAAVCLSGCATYRPRQIDVRRSLAAFEARRLDAPALRQYMEQALHRPLAAWPLQSWDFEHLTLAADFYSADLAVARAKLDQAEAALITAGARPNPTLALSPSYDIAKEPGISPWTLGFTLDIPFETAGKRGYRIAEARNRANAASLEAASVGWRVRNSLRDSLVQLQAAERAQEIVSRRLAAETLAARLLADRLSVGQASATEVEVVRIAADQSALQLQDSRRQAQQARFAVAAALGVPATALDGIRMSLAALDTFPSPEQAAPSREQALLDRTDVLAALAAYEASDSALRLEIARQYPDLAIGPGFSHGYTASELENSLTIGVSLTLPILNRNQGPIAEAEARRREAAANFNAVQARAVTQVDAALSGYRASLAKLDTANGLLAEQRRRIASVQALFHAGQTDRLTLAQGRSELATDELARLRAFTEAQLALGGLENAMQRAPEQR
jgi:outer membrane protein, heavy metal efflux system